MICLLDLDGTLIDSTKRHWVLMAKLLKQYCPEKAGEFDAAGYMQYKADGHSGKQYLTEILHLEDAKAGEIQREWQAHIEEEEYLKLDQLYNDTIPFLEGRKEQGDTIIYLTARQSRQGLYAALDRLKIRDYASRVIVVDPRNAKAEKVAAAQELQRAGADLMLVGDTENEYAAAQELQVPVYLLNRGFRSKGYWEACEVITYESLLDIMTGY
ncbi:MAG: HAD family hydrolase [Lachnospiraceae bacterium]|nr:HAD family hydrolase [Lachnospiraceae bacterium]